jgi:hypothetical protein
MTPCYLSEAARPLALFLNILSNISGIGDDQFVDPIYLSNFLKLVYF